MSGIFHEKISDEIYQALKSKRYCCFLNLSEGESTLIANQVKQQLLGDGIQCSVISLKELEKLEPISTQTEENWYSAIVRQLAKAFTISNSDESFKKFLKARFDKHFRDRLKLFIETVLFTKFPQTELVIIFDQIEHLEALNFLNDSVQFNLQDNSNFITIFFEKIFECYEERKLAHNEQYQNLTFALIGSPLNNLEQYQESSLFNISFATPLEDSTAEALDPSQIPILSLVSNKVDDRSHIADEKVEFMPCFIPEVVHSSPSIPRSVSQAPEIDSSLVTALENSSTAIKRHSNFPLSWIKIANIALIALSAGLAVSVYLLYQDNNQLGTKVSGDTQQLKQYRQELKDSENKIEQLSQGSKELEKKVNSLEQEKIQLQQDNDQLKQGVEKFAEEVESSIEEEYPSSSGGKFKFKNRCSQPIDLALRYKNLSGQWETRGWWSFDSNQNSYSILTDSNNKAIEVDSPIFYYYAETTGSGTSHKWFGERKVSLRGRIISMRFVFLEPDSNGDLLLSLTCN